MEVTSINQNLRTNDQIRVSPVRLIGPDNEQYGIVSNTEALQRARELGLDLVEVAPNVRPPVCRLINYGKWKYNQKKHLKKSQEQSLKEVRLRPKTDTNDRLIKIRRAVKFLKKGHKVQFTMVFRGRERAHREIGFETFQSIVEEFGQRVKVERAPRVDGRLMVMVLAPVKDAFDDVETEDDLVDDEEDEAIEADVDEDVAESTHADEENASNSSS